MTKVLKKSEIISLIIIFISLFIFTVQVYLNRSIFLQKFNPAKYEEKFLESQWRVPESKNVISDEDLYSYAAYKYIHGENPILINSETPHLGKYLIGLSILIFNNQRIFSIIIALLTLGVIYKLILMQTKSSLLSSLGVLLTALNTTFIDQIIHSPQLDIYQLFFFLLMAYFLIQYITHKNNHSLLLSAFFYGCTLSTKFFFQSYLLITLFMIIFFAKQYGKKFCWIKPFIIFNAIALVIYTLSHFSYFLHGGDIRGFLGMQKWIILLYKSTSINLLKVAGGYLGLIFLNSYRFWSEGYPLVSYQYWSLFWPITFVLGMILAIVNFVSKNKHIVSLFFSSWVIIYAFFLLIVPIYPRYLLLLFVPQIILIVLYGKKFIT